jgi:hypothetical protein
MDGHVFIYETADLKYYTQIACTRKSKSKAKRRPASADKSKVTGISFLTSRGASEPVSGRRPVSGTKDKYNLLVTTNDSRIRLFSMSDFTLIVKLKGPLNSTRQIRATGSLDGRSVICGSDTGDVFVWRLPAVSALSEEPLRGGGSAHGGSIDVGDLEGQSKGSATPLSPAPLQSSGSTVECYVLPARLKTTKASATAGDPSSGSTGKEESMPCTATAFVPLSSIHFVHETLRSADTNTTLRAMNPSSRYSPQDLSSLAILTAGYDGSLHVLYAPE